MNSRRSPIKPLYRMAFEAVSAVALVAAWVIVAATADGVLREREVAEQSRVEATSKVAFTTSPSPAVSSPARRAPAHS